MRCNNEMHIVHVCMYYRLTVHWTTSARPNIDGYNDWFVSLLNWNVPPPHMKTDKSSLYYNTVIIVCHN